MSFCSKFHCCIASCIDFSRLLWCDETRTAYPWVRQWESWDLQRALQILNRNHQDQDTEEEGQSSHRPICFIKPAQQMLVQSKEQRLQEAVSERVSSSARTCDLGKSHCTFKHKSWCQEPPAAGEASNTQL